MAVAQRPDQIVAGYQAATYAIRQRVLAYVLAVWGNSPAFRDSDVERLVARIAPVVRSGQMQVANLTDQYIGRMSVLAGVTWSAGVDRAEITGYRGVPDSEVYRRPAVEMYTALAGGAPFEVARTQSLNRLKSIVSTDLQQAKNRQSAAAIGRSGFQYFRRQLTGRENCALCVIASTQRYHRGDLMPVHPGCDCGVQPYTAGRDPGQVLDSATLEMTHQAIAEKFGDTDRGGREIGLDNPIADFLDVIVSNPHGELGPTLAWRGDHFTGPGQIAA